MSQFVGILGGTFNPVHIGHLRLAASVADALHLTRLECMPCAVPPHKHDQGLLPFEMRVSLLRAALEEASQPNAPELVVSTLEGELAAPSYTWNLIQAWRERYPDKEPLFVLGGEDFAQLATWKRGLELPAITSFVVVPRGAFTEHDFQHTAAAYWPDHPMEKKSEGISFVRVTENTSCFFLPLPHLDISSSHLRAHWLRGGSIQYLTPAPVVTLLEAHRPEISRYWRGK